MISHPAPFTLDQLTAGELSEETEQQIREHLADCKGCQQYLNERLSEQDELIERLSPPVFAARIRDELATQQRKSEPSSKGLLARRWYWGTALSAAAAAILAVVVINLYNVGPPDDDRIRWMGDSAVVQLQILREGNVLSGVSPIVGDRVRYEVILPPDQQGYGVLIAVEEGQAFVVLPEDGNPIHLSDATLIPGSVDLQPEGGEVHLLLFVRAEPFSSEALVDEVERSLEDTTSEWPLGLAHEITVDLGER